MTERQYEHLKLGKRKSMYGKEALYGKNHNIELERADNFCDFFIQSNIRPGL